MEIIHLSRGIGKMCFDQDTEDERLLDDADDITEEDDLFDDEKE
jgi:hypothetical protein